MTPRLRVSAPAKVNLCLGVGPVRADGYHPLATVYQAVGLRDTLELERVEGATRVLTVGGTAAHAGVPQGEDNLAVRAVTLLAEHHGRELGVGIHLDKAIPVAGGLAGGSADAAAALLGADLLLDSGTPRDVLLELAARLGSDVPFCLVGGTAAGSGRGELVTPVETRGTFWWVVVPDPSGLSTPAVYAEFDRLAAGRPVPAPVVPDALLRGLADGDAVLLGASLRNDLEAAALSLRPDLADVLAAGRAGGDGAPGALGALVSGSGPTTVFLCADETHAAALRDHLERRLRAAPDRGDAPAPFVVSAPAAGARRESTATAGAGR